VGLRNLRSRPALTYTQIQRKTASRRAPVRGNRR